jgi:UDP-N-acetyl-D-glucosamine dehydrogenase
VGAVGKSIALTDEAVDAADAVLVLTDHSGIDYAGIRDRARVFVDTRNAAGSVAK